VERLSSSLEWCFMQRISPIFLDKLGERLSSERIGTRLYQAFLHKIRFLEDKQGVQLKEVEKIYQDELRHMHLLIETLTDLGVDPNIMTPSARISAVMSIGIVQILSDPRTTVQECLCALLHTELTDNVGWELLIQLAEQTNRDELAQQFTKVLQQEQKHLASVRRWVSESNFVEPQRKVNRGAKILKLRTRDFIIEKTGK
jgi:hypothetical protein